MTIEKLDWGAVAIAYDWPAIVIRVLVEIAFAILADVPCELVGPEIFFAPERLEVCREALDQPCVRPVAAGQQVAPPLMREFVRDQRIAFEIQMRARVMQRIGGLRGCRSIFHPAENEIADCDLRILRVRVGDSDDALEELDHARGVAERAARVVLASRMNVVGDG